MGRAGLPIRGAWNFSPHTPRLPQGQLWAGSIISLMAEMQPACSFSEKGRQDVPFPCRQATWEGIALSFSSFPRTSLLSGVCQMERRSHSKGQRLKVPPRGLQKRPGHDSAASSPSEASLQPPGDRRDKALAVCASHSTDEPRGANLGRISLKSQRSWVAGARRKSKYISVTIWEI